MYISQFYLACRVVPLRKRRKKKTSKPLANTSTSFVVLFTLLGWHVHPSVIKFKLLSQINEMINHIVDAIS